MTIAEGDDLADALKALKLPSRSLVLLPINDNTDPSRVAGGSHWSLLVFDRRGGGEGGHRQCFTHYDSSRGSANRRVAQHVASALAPLLAHAKEASAASPSSAASDRPGADIPSQVTEGVAPQQRNGYDCGIHSIRTAAVLADWYLAGKDGEIRHHLRGSLVKHLAPDAVTAYRGELLRRIQALPEPPRK